MKITSVILLIIIIHSSCKKQEYYVFTGTHYNYVEFSILNEEYIFEGGLIFSPANVDTSEYRITRKCPSYNITYTNSTDDRPSLIYLSIPIFAEMINDSLIGKKYPIESVNCGNDNIGSNLFGLSLSINTDNSYSTWVINDSTKYYNRINEINYLGPYYGDIEKIVYEVKGEFNIAVQDYSVSPRDTIIISDGRYSCCIVTFK